MYRFGKDYFCIVSILMATIFLTLSGAAAAAPANADAAPEGLKPMEINLPASLPPPARAEDYISLAADSRPAVSGYNMGHLLSRSRNSGLYGTVVLSRQANLGNNAGANLYSANQLTVRNFPAEDNIVLVGAGGVRAFSLSEAPGDERFLISAGLRWQQPGSAGDKNKVLLTEFYGYGNTVVDRNLRPVTGTNGHRLANVGLGIIWARNSDFFVRCDYAWRVGDEQRTSDPNADSQYRLQVVYYF